MVGRIVFVLAALSMVTACAGAGEVQDQTEATGGGLTTSQCQGLSEQVCLTTQGCELVYSGCAMCAPGSTCPPCESEPRCQDADPLPPPPPPGGSCYGLDEATCYSRSDCLADHGACPAVCEEDENGGCKPCPPSYFGCYPAFQPLPHCEGLSERGCNQASGCIGIYSGNCPPCPQGAACTPCDPETFSFSHCTQDVLGCGGWNGGGDGSDGVDEGSPSP
jgi:hypothetical protein